MKNKENLEKAILNKVASQQGLLTIKELNAARRLLKETINNRVIEMFDNDGMYTSYANLALELLKVLKEEGYTKRTIKTDSLQGINISYTDEDWAVWFYIHNGNNGEVDTVSDDLIFNTKFHVTYMDIVFNYKAVNTLLYTVLIKCADYFKLFQSTNSACCQFKLSNSLLAGEMEELANVVTKEVLDELNTPEVKVFTTLEEIAEDIKEKLKPIESENAWSVPYLPF